MPYLGDYVGHLAAEMAIARFHADLEAIRIAELYASNELLRHMAVPRFRLPKVTIDVPVAIKEMEEVERGMPPRGGVALSTLHEAFVSAFDFHLRQANIDLLASEKSALQNAIDQEVSRLAQPPELTGSVLYVADELVATVTRVLSDPKREGKPIDPAQLDGFLENLKAEVHLKFLKLREPPPRLNVLVTTAELREAGPTEFLARLQFIFTEEAFEWTIVESQGHPKSRLIPE